MSKSAATRPKKSATTAPDEVHNTLPPYSPPENLIVYRASSSENLGMNRAFSAENLSIHYHGSEIGTLLKNIMNFQELLTSPDYPSDVKNNLQGISFDTPEIVVVGDDKAGKSSLLERICGMSYFPRAGGTCTRMPIELTLCPCSSKDMEDCIRVFFIIFAKAGKITSHIHSHRQQIQNWVTPQRHSSIKIK
jgi:hypothetical protein